MSARLRPRLAVGTRLRLISWAIAALVGVGGASLAQAPRRLPNVSLALDMAREAPPAREDAPLPPQTARPATEAVSASLTLAELEYTALANNPAVARAAARVEAARGACQQAGLPPNPRAGYQGSEIGNDGGTAGMQGGYLAQEFIRGGKLEWSRAAACQGVLRAQQELEVQRLRVQTDVRVEFSRAVAAQKRVVLAEEIARLNAKSIETIQSLIDVGTASSIDLLQGRIERETAEIALENARNRHLTAWRRLSAATGMPESKPQKLEETSAGAPSRVEFEEALARILSESPELAAARFEAQRAAYALERERREPIANIDVMLGAQKDFGSGDTIANVQIEMPIAIWNRNQGGIYQARAEMMAAQVEVSRLEAGLRARLATAFERYANARQQAQRYDRRILVDASEALRLTNTAFENGQIGYLNVLTAQRTYVQARMAQLDAATELRAAAALIEGMLLSGSLEGDSPGPLASGM